MGTSRVHEVVLLILAHLMLGLGYFVVWQSYLPVWRTHYPGAQMWQFFAPVPILLVMWLLTSWALAKRGSRETLLLPAVALLVGLGLLFLLRLAGGAESLGLQHTGYDLGNYSKQLVSFGLAWAGLMSIILLAPDYRRLADFKYVIALIAVGLLLTTTIFGHATGGQTITLKLGPVNFQPHELVKLLIVVFMAAYLVEKQELIAFARGKFGMLTAMDLRYLGPMLALWFFILGIVFIHDDLGAAFLLFGALLGMLYLGTGRLNYVIIGLLLAIFGIVGGYQIGKSAGLGFVKRIDTRIAIWQNPWLDVDNKGYQITQGLMALGNGRVVGAGLAAGYPESIPAVHTDMIYTAISEDLGLVGAVAVLGVFLVIIWRIFRVGLRAPDRFGQLLAAGLAVSLALQAWIILAGATKLIPLTGITLPFISFGGTSLVVNLVLIGMVFKVAERRQ